MTITTIFNPGDTVWTLSKNQIVETKIVELYGHLDGGGEIRPEERLQWELEHTEPYVGFNLKIHRPESRLFRSRDELIASL